MPSMTGCHCLCPVLHPKQPGICTGFMQKYVPIKAGKKMINASMCEPCAKSFVSREKAS